MDSSQPINLNVLGIDIAFKPDADMKRAKQAARFVEQRYEVQKLKSDGKTAKEVLLTFLVLGLADELLQLRTSQKETQLRLFNLLEQIEKSI